MFPPECKTLSSSQGRNERRYHPRKVKKTGVSYDLSTDQMIYLKNQGVSQNVITALLQAGPASAPAAPASTSSSSSLPPPPSSSAPAPDSGGGQSSASAAPASSAEPMINFDYFQGQLSPYGSWVDVPGYGQCWQPSVSSGWRPYYDAGHWVYSDAGLYWQSDNPWGALVFHYGSWTYAGAYGWVWVPGYEYAPSWVFWRHADGYLGWAPLPPGAVFIDGGWTWGGRRFGADYDFGYGASFYVFVGYDHFWEHDYHRFILRGDEYRRIYGRSEINGFAGMNTVGSSMKDWTGSTWSGSQVAGWKKCVTKICGIMIVPRYGWIING